GLCIRGTATCRWQGRAGANPLILVSARVIRGAAHRAPAQKEAAMHNRSRVPLWAAALSVAVLAVEVARSCVSYPRGSRPDDEERNRGVISTEPGRGRWGRTPSQVPAPRREDILPRLRANIGQDRAILLAPRGEVP